MGGGHGLCWQWQWASVQVGGAGGHQWSKASTPVEVGAKCSGNSVEIKAKCSGNSNVLDLYNPLTAIPCHHANWNSWLQIQQQRVTSAEQEYSLVKARVKHNWAQSPHGWATVTMLGLATTPRFLQSQTLCRLEKSWWDYNWSPPCVCTHAKRSHTHVKDPVVNVQVQRITKKTEV